jgi:hypothetical protein
LALVDELARLQLTAQRLGCSIRLRHQTPELSLLLDLCGLAGLFDGNHGGPGSVVEMLRQTESREQSGVEEDGELDDPSF